MEFKLKAKAFGGILQVVRLRVEDGEVRVWDDVAGHYVPSFAAGLSRSAVARALRLAALRLTVGGPS